MKKDRADFHQAVRSIRQTDGRAGREKTNQTYTRIEPMNPNTSSPSRGGDSSQAMTILATTVLLVTLLAASARADMYRSATNAPGGIQATFSIAAASSGTNTTLSWYGPHAWYTVQWKTNISAPWVDLLTVAATNHSMSVSFNDQGRT